MSDNQNFDEKADALGKPIEEPNVKVRAKPVQRDLPKKQASGRKRAEGDNDTNRKVAKKVEENVEKIVKDAAKKAGSKPGATRQDQFDAAKEAADTEAESIPRQRVKEFSVTVGDEHSENTTKHVPKDGGPPPDEATDDN